MISGNHLHYAARWRGLVRLVLVLAMATAAFTVKAENVWSEPKIWSEPDTWSDGFSPMRFVVVRSSVTGCEPNCPEWISAEGAIEAGTPAKLKRILKILGRRQLPIVVNSPGGNVDAALQLGRLIRKNKLDIAVGTTSFYDCLPGVTDCPADDGKGTAYLGIASDGGAMCNSACPLMFAGGIRRVVGRWAYLGVHQITTTYRREQVYYRTTYRIVHGRKKVVSTKVISRTDAGSHKTYEMSKAMERKLSAYLKEMGVDRAVLETMKRTPASDIHQISLDDMATMKLVTSKHPVDMLTSASLCRRNEPAPNCREVPGNKTVTPAAAAKVAASPATVATTLPEATKAPMEMRFVVVRGRDPLCNPDCPEWIAAEGTITPQTPQKLRELLATLGNRRLPVLISSQGGDLFSALIAGRLIHERKLDVAVARTNIVGCDPPEAGCLDSNGAYVGLTSDFGVECDSACALMLAGGARRLVSPKARLSLYLMGQKKLVKAYLEEMAIDPGLFAVLEQRSVERQLEPEMMLKVGLTTGPQSVDALTGATICNAVPKPENCRMVSSPDAQAEPPAKL